jgi:hypothetical protein
VSLQALLWALNDAPCEDHAAVLVLLALADNAAEDGSGAGPSIATMAQRARCSTRTVQRHLRTLEDAGLIANGDQQLVAYIRGDKRPTVYDLKMAHKRGDIVTPRSSDGVSPPAPRGDKPGTDGVTTGGLRTTQPPTEETAEQTVAASSGTKGTNELARDIVKWWWDRLDIKPAGARAWFACVGAVEAMLKAGHPAKAVASALREAGTPVTVARLEIQIKKGGAFRETNEDHWKSGGGF